MGSEMCIRDSRYTGTATPQGGHNSKPLQCHPLLQAEQADARPARPGNHGNEAADPSLIQTQVAKIQRTSTATPASCWAACSGLGCLSCGVVLPLLCAVSPLMASGAIVLADPANHRRLSQQNPYKTRVSLVPLSRFFLPIKHFIG